MQGSKRWMWFLSLAVVCIGARAPAQGSAPKPCDTPAAPPAVQPAQPARPAPAPSAPNPWDRWKQVDASIGCIEDAAKRADVAREGYAATKRLLDLWETRDYQERVATGTAGYAYRVERGIEANTSAARTAEIERIWAIKDHKQRNAALQGRSLAETMQTLQDLRAYARSHRDNAIGDYLKREWDRFPGSYYAFDKDEATAWYAADQIDKLERGVDASQLILQARPDLAEQASALIEKKRAQVQKELPEAVFDSFQKAFEPKATIENGSLVVRYYPTQATRRMQVAQALAYGYQSINFNRPKRTAPLTIPISADESMSYWMTFGNTEPNKLAVVYANHSIRATGDEALLVPVFTLSRVSGSVASKTFVRSATAELALNATVFLGSEILAEKYGPGAKLAVPFAVLVSIIAAPRAARMVLPAKAPALTSQEIQAIARARMCATAESTQAVTSATKESIAELVKKAQAKTDLANRMRASTERTPAVADRTFAKGARNADATAGLSAKEARAAADRLDNEARALLDEAARAATAADAAALLELAKGPAHTAVRERLAQGLEADAARLSDPKLRDFEQNALSRALSDRAKAIGVDGRELAAMIERGKAARQAEALQSARQAQQAASAAQEKTLDDARRVLNDPQFRDIPGVRMDHLPGQPGPAGLPNVQLGPVGSPGLRIDGTVRSEGWAPTGWPRGAPLTPEALYQHPVYGPQWRELVPKLQGAGFGKPK